MSESDRIVHSPSLSESATLGDENTNPVLEFHITGVVTYMNPAAQEKFPDLPSLGLRHPVLEGLPEIISALQTNDARSVQRQIRTGKHLYEQKIAMAKGSEFVRICIIDLTDRKRTEDYVQMANLSLVKLATELKQSERRLYTTESQLIQAEKMSAIGQLASGIAHEVKNPLAILMKGVNYLEREFSSDRGQQSEVLRMMKDAILRADQIVRDLLDFARPASLELKPVTIHRVLETAIDLAEQQFTVRRIHIVKEIAPDLEPVMIDENRMKQAFINLMLNAFQAMSEGGQLTIRAYTKTLTQVGGRVGRRSTDVFRVGQTVLVCELNDTGRGIPAEMLAKIFDPFFTTNPPGQGTGLGLTITKTIIEQHRGLIEIQSQEGRGTTVMVMLPT